MAYGLDILADPGLSWSAGDDVLFGGPYSDVLSRFATLESGGGQYRSNPMSSARGLLHFLPSTWEGVLRNNPDLGFSPSDIDDDEKQMAAGERLLGNEIVPALKRALGRDPQPAEMYAGWMLGAGGAQKLYGANPGAVAAELFDPRVARSNPSVFFWDKEQTRPRTVAEVAAEMERRYSGARPMKEPPQMAQQPEYDIDQGLANMGQMAERVGQMQPNMPMPQGGTQPFGLNPYLYLAAQLMPQRKGGGWGDAAMAAGAAMMQSNRPDLLGGVGAGLQAANQSMARDEEQRYRDQVGTLDLGLKMAQLGQKEAKQPLIKEFKEGDRIVTKQWNGAMWVPMADAPANAPPAGFVRGPDGKLIADPGYLDAQKQIREAGRPTTNIDLKGETKEKEAVGKALGEMYADKIALGAKGRQLLDTVTRADQLLEGLNTGALAPTAITAQKYLTALGIPLEVFGDAGKLGQAEAAMAVANQMALQLRSTGEGGGMPGAMSDKDREFLVSMAPGLGQTPEGRKLIVDSFKRLAKRQIDEARMAEKWFDEKGTMRGFNAHMQEYADANPLFAGAKLPTVPQSGGPAATTPGPRELPPSDADIRRQQQQQAPAQPQSGGSGLPMPKRFDLGGPKAGGAGLPAPDAIRTMDRSALEALFPRVSEMTNEQLMALQARRRQLLGIDPAPGGTP